MYLDLHAVRTHAQAHQPLLQPAMSQKPDSPTSEPASSHVSHPCSCYPPLLSLLSMSLPICISSISYTGKALVSLSHQDPAVHVTAHSPPTHQCCTASCWHWTRLCQRKLLCPKTSASVLTAHTPRPLPFIYAQTDNSPTPQAASAFLDHSNQSTIASASLAS